MALGAERQSSLIETLAGLDAVKVNNAESERQYHWEQTIGTLSRLELRVKILSGLAMNITLLIQQLAGVAMICFGVYQIIDGNLSMGGLVACYMLSGRALGPLASVVGSVDPLPASQSDHGFGRPDDGAAARAQLRRAPPQPSGVAGRDGIPQRRFHLPEQQNLALKTHQSGGPSRREDRHHRP
jgi:ATP-binding cassette subfamily C protein LapB